MWDSLTESDRNTIEEISNYFIPKFPEIEPEVIRNRIFNGYCWGEAGSHIVSIEDWNSIFYGSGLQKDILTCFDDWDDYIKHDGDFHRKLKMGKKEEP